MTWNILLIQPNREFIAAGALEGFGFEVYLTTLACVVRVGASRRRVPRFRPMFPGYLFVMASAARQGRVHAAPGVRSYLMGRDGPASLSEAAVALVREMERGARVEPSFPRRVRLGDRVRISGHDLEGLLVALDKSDRAVVEVLIQPRAVALADSAAQSEAVHPAWGRCGNDEGK